MEYILLEILVVVTAWVYWPELAEIVAMPAGGSSAIRSRILFDPMAVSSIGFDFSLDSYTQPTVINKKFISIKAFFLNLFIGKMNNFYL